MDGGYFPVEFNVLTYFLLAGFEVTTIGRFWVTAEEMVQEYEPLVMSLGNPMTRGC
jgi:hypothetical protein